MWYHTAKPGGWQDTGPKRERTRKAPGAVFHSRRERTGVPRALVRKLVHRSRIPAFPNFHVGISPQCTTRCWNIPHMCALFQHGGPKTRTLRRYSNMRFPNCRNNASMYESAAIACWNIAPMYDLPHYAHRNTGNVRIGFVRAGADVGRTSRFPISFIARWNLHVERHMRPAIAGRPPDEAAS